MRPQTCCERATCKLCRATTLRGVSIKTLRMAVGSLEGHLQSYESVGGFWNDYTVGDEDGMRALINVARAELRRRRARR